MPVGFALSFLFFGVWFLPEQTHHQDLHCKMIEHRLTKCKVVSVAKHDHKITTTTGPFTAQSQVTEVASLIETNASNPSGKQKEDRA